MRDYIEIFEKNVRQIMQTYGISPLQEIPKSVITGKINKPDPLWKDVEKENDVLKINSAKQKLLDGLLYRESFRVFIPQALEPFRFSYDLAMLYAYVNLSASNRKKWFEYWSEDKVTLKNLKGWKYVSPDHMIQAYYTRKYHFIHASLTFLTYCNKYDLNLDSFIEYISQCFSGKEIILDNNEIMVLSGICNKHTISPSKLSISLPMGPSQISQILKRLRKKGIIIKSKRINFHKLGLCDYFIIFKNLDQDMDTLKKFFGSHYLIFWIQLYKISKYSSLFFYRAPSSELFTKLLLEYLKEISQEMNTEIIILKTLDLSIPNTNFDFYLPNKGWSFSWILLRQYVSALFKDKSSSVQKVPIQNNEQNNERISFDRVDLNLLQYIYTHLTFSIASLRKALGIGQTALIKKLRSLKKQNVIMNRPFFLNVPGLTEKMYLLLRLDGVCFYDIVKFFKLFPYSFPYHVTGNIIKNGKIHKSDFHGAIIYLSLPYGHTIEFIKLLDRHPNLNNSLFLCEKEINIFREYGLPIDAWDDDKKTWKMKI